MGPFTRKLLEEWAGKDTYQRGLRLFETGKTKQVKYDPPFVKGIIDKPPRGLRTSFKIDDHGRPENLCPCMDSRDRGLFCSHAVALGLEVIQIFNHPERLAKLEMEQRRAKRMEELGDEAFIHRGGGTEAALVLRLGEDWRDEEDIPLMVKISVNGKTVPVESISREQTLSFQARDENTLMVLEDIAEGAPRNVMHLSAPDFCNILDVWQDGVIESADGNHYKVVKEKAETRLFLDLDRENGELLLFIEPTYGHATDLPFYILGRSEAWMCYQDQFRKLDRLLPGPLQAIYRNPVVIARPSIPAFLCTEWPMLQQISETSTELDEDWFEFRPAQPSFHVLFKGSLASLSVHLDAVYDNVVFVAGKPDASRTFARPLEDDLLAYEVRNMEAEKKALERLGDIGFVGTSGDSLEAVVGTRSVLNVLATTIPSLRRLGWTVQLEGPVAEKADSFEYVTPVVNIQSNTDAGGWFEVGFDLELPGGESLQMAEVQRAIRNGDSHVKRGGRTILFDSDAIDSMQEVFGDCASGEGREAGTFRMDGVFSSYVQSALCGVDGVDIEATPEWLQTAREQNREIKTAPVKLPSSLEKVLRPYQKEGVNWLNYIAENGFSGILADDMGLGKTLQTLTWIQHKLDEQEGDAQALIICPTSLVENWLDEAEKWTPELNAIALTGSSRHTRWQELDQADIVVTSYALIRRDLDQYRTRNFSIIALDEAQHIKNASTQNAKAVKQLQGQHRMALTGTPVENSVNDVWSIMDFLMPHYLGSAEHFKTHYQGPISRGGDEAEKAQARLRKKLHPFLLRRLKKDVAKDLPPKIEQISYCTLTRDQQLVYGELLKQSQNKISDLIAQKGFNRARMEVLTTLLRLRQASCHLGLLQLQGMEKSQHPSGKLDHFFELLEESMEGGHRMLVFSQFTSMLGLLREALEEREILYEYLDGSTKNRQDRVKRFNKDRRIPVFLISLKAGGTGLNLTGADRVVHFDPWWNPAVENQATDRAYRIGQKRTVYSYKLITKGTVEEKVLKMQAKKKAVIDSTVEGDEQIISQFSKEDIEELLEL